MKGFGVGRQPQHLIYFSLQRRRGNCMIERTLVLVKPDGIYRALVGKIISTFEDAGLKIVGVKMLRPTKELVEKHYIWDEAWAKNVWEKTAKAAEEKGLKPSENYVEMGQRIRNLLIKYIVSKPVIAMVVEGNEAISIVRKLVGATSPSRADPGSIRGKYSSDSYDMGDSKKRAVKNLIHASEDKVTAEREIQVWFTKEELIDYGRADEAAQYEE